VAWFRKTRQKPSTVELFELLPDGAAFSWNDDRSRAVALEMFVELARRLEGEERVERLRLSSGMAEPLDAADPIDVADVRAFVDAAPQLVRPYYKFYRFQFRLNEGERPYTVHHLDQSPRGFWFQTPVEGEPFVVVLRRVLTDFAAGDVRISTGPWFTRDEAS